VASDVDPGAIGSSKPSEPPVMEQAPAQPVTTPTWEEVDASAPPPSSAPEEMDRAPTPSRMDELSD